MRSWSLPGHLTSSSIDVGGIQALALPSAPSTIPLTASCAEAACSANPGKEKEEKKTNEEGKEDEDGGRRKRFQLYA